MRRATLVLLTLVMTLCGGCLAPGKPAQDITIEPFKVGANVRSDATYWAVSVAGRETWRDGPTAGLCDVRFDHGIDRAARRIEYLAEQYRDVPERPPAVIAWDHFDTNDCPLAYKLDFDSRGTGHIGAGRQLKVRVETDGRVILDDATTVPLGRQARIAYETERDGRAVKGELVVVNLGAWPLSELRPARW